MMVVFHSLLFIIIIISQGSKDSLLWSYKSSQTSLPRLTSFDGRRIVKTIRFSHSDEKVGRTHVVEPLPGALNVQSRHSVSPRYNRVVTFTCV